MEPILRWLVALTLVLTIVVSGLEQPGLAVLALLLFVVAAWAYVKLTEEHR